MKQKKLEAEGWQIGSVDEFLGLTPDESNYIELKLALSQELKHQRTNQGISQSLLAKRIGSSQSRIAKAEASDPSVSMDLLVRALLAMGVTRAALANAIRKTSVE